MSDLAVTRAGGGHGRMALLLGAASLLHRRSVQLR
jgi:hypothetical protein